VAALAVALAVLATGCATNPLPSDRHVSQEAAITSGRGAYTLAFLSAGGQLTGELISADRGHVLLLGDDHELRALKYDELNELRLGVHDNNKGGYIAWMVLGTLSTASHGFWLVFSAPTWLIAGGVSVAAESQRGVFDCRPREDTKHPEASCLELAGNFSRFPQGLPPGVGKAQLLGRAPVPAPAAEFPKPYEPAP
jgi:hypothetical protein